MGSEMCIRDRPCGVRREELFGRVMVVGGRNGGPSFGVGIAALHDLCREVRLRHRPEPDVPVLEDRHHPGEVSDGNRGGGDIVHPGQGAGRSPTPQAISLWDDCSVQQKQCCARADHVRS